MNSEEAKDLLDNLIGMVEDNQNNDYDEALKLGIEALEKQIPKEPTNRLCPTCGSITHTDCGDSFLDYSLEFCPNCGQALKWE